MYFQISHRLFETIAIIYSCKETRGVLLHETGSAHFRLFSKMAGRAIKPQEVGNSRIKSANLHFDDGARTLGARTGAAGDDNGQDGGDGKHGDSGDDGNGGGG